MNMPNTYTFNPNYRVVGKFEGVRSIPDLEREVGVYSATPEFVRAHCGPITVGILDLIPVSYYQEAADKGLFVNIDVRIHRLYPGDFPAYPGWHCDGEFRETYFSQPDLDRVPVHNHLCATVSSHEEGISNTEFFAEPLSVEVSNPTAGHTLWGQVDERIRKSDKLRFAWRSSDGQVVRFDSWTLHRCTAARARGWRLFFRMSMWHKPNLGDGGMVSKQEQVYKIVEGSGW
jgi:hypothetical protein